jgi:hypothetical protein
MNPVNKIDKRNGERLKKRAKIAFPGRRRILSDLCRNSKFYKLDIRDKITGI